ncbi:MAG: carbon-monoxide dehydrogenase large subunit [Isosphaeraceae bacterium]|jgi:xanthine dehydrogenase YagR molybdenum-binding subunit|nr:MAG: carbon-monoxide dehydrogenase large subunit [Isosphaeraceae bacterium]
MAEWPQNPRLISTEIPRVDGLGKASGRTKYPSDVHPEGMLFAAMLYSPHAHARIKKIDTSRAERIPGVRAIHLLAQEGATLRYQGDDIAAVAADTEEIARDGVRAIEVEYEVLPHVATESQAMAEGAPRVNPRGNVQKGRAQINGDPDAAIETADAVIEGEYSVPVITHVCLETHGLTVRWDSDRTITAWSSTQNVMGVSQELGGAFNIPPTNVTTLTEVMGGGFGSKFSADSWGIAAAELAKKTGKPVRLFLDRAQEHMAAGNRPSATGKIRLGAAKDGKLVAMIAQTHGTGGVARGAGFPLPYVYAVPHSRREHSDVFLNGGNARAMRAPGHPEGCCLMEAAMDDLAEKLGVDPLEMRLKNLPEGDFKTPIYEAEIRLGAEAIGWSKRKPRGQAEGRGPIRIGYGMGLHTWGGGGAQDKQVSCIINPDGSVELRSATQDIGTGARTILAIIAAEVLGLEVDQIHSNIGNSSFPPGQASGGSTTTPSMAPPALNAATQARDELFRRVGRAINEDPAGMSLAGGKLLINGKEAMSFAEACRKLGMMPISVTAGFSEGLTSSGVGGCQFAEVEVDLETGVVRVKKIVAVQDSGLILDMLTWRSQVYGGVIGGLNYALFEERVMDPTTGLFLNPDMELYKLAGASDIPEIEVIAYHTPEMRARGVIGVGEPPTISTAAAIGNAVSNAIGVRVPRWPMTPMNVLNALAQVS